MNARCEDCDRATVAAFTDSGHRVPVDPEPDPGGTLVLWHDTYPDGRTHEDAVPRVSSFEAFEAMTGQRFAGPGWRPHAETCALWDQPAGVPVFRGATLEAIEGGRAS